MSTTTLAIYARIHIFASRGQIVPHAQLVATTKDAVGGLYGTTPELVIPVTCLLENMLSGREVFHPTPTVVR